MDYKKPERAALTYWRIKQSIGLLITIGVLGAAAFIMCRFEFFEEGTMARTLATIAFALFLLAQILSVIILPAIEYKQWEYAIADDRVVIKHGIFFIEKSTIPIIRIQNVTTEQGPIQRLFGLYSVELALASGTFDIVGLNRETAEDISEKLNARLRERIAANEAKDKSEA
ncbi:MAG: PH domain-containing protein [Mogibacterium sp.]|nr:PH domain-containing protein [Mogibacterium sp.]